MQNLRFAVHERVRTDRSNQILGLSSAGHDDKMASIDLLLSGQWQLGSSATWITNRLPPLCPRKCFISNCHLNINSSLKAKVAPVHQGHFIRCQECVCCMFMCMLLCTCSPSTLPTSHEAAHGVSGRLYCSHSSSKTEIFIFNEMFTAADLFW